MGRQLSRIRWSRRRRRFGAGAAVVLLASLAFGMSPSDVAALREFWRAGARWQTAPEFRKIAIEYCIQGSAACRTHFLLVPTGRLIMMVRSLPRLPKRFATNPGSKSHYDDFGRGPLCAYLHLSREQSVGDVAGVVANAARLAIPGQALERCLDAFQMDFPVVKDGGALASVSALLADVNARQPFTIRDSIVPLLREPIIALAQALNIPGDPNEMSPGQQREVLERLDGWIRHHDHELWRAKQLNDFAGGIWAQVFTPAYNRLLLPFLLLHDIAQVVLPIVLIVMLLERKRSTRKRAPNKRVETHASAET